MQWSLHEDIMRSMNNRMLWDHWQGCYNIRMRMLWIHCYNIYQWKGCYRIRMRMSWDHWYQITKENALRTQPTTLIAINPTERNLTLESQGRHTPPYYYILLFERSPTHTSKEVIHCTWQTKSERCSPGNEPQTDWLWLGALLFWAKEWGTGFESRCWRFISMVCCIATRPYKKSLTGESL